MKDPVPYRLIELPETTSTNDEVKCRLPETEEKYLVVSTPCQTAGRGQAGNKWESEVGKNLLYSIGVKPLFLPPRRQFVLLQAASLAICTVLDGYADGFTIKWPNDIYFGELKISGTLIENELRGSQFRHCVLGTGINLNQTSFSPYPPNPVSLKMIIGRETDSRQVLHGIVMQFIRYYEALEQGGEDDIQKEYQSRLFRREGFHIYRDALGTFKARIDGIEPDGRLLLRDSDGYLRCYGFKEVKYLLEKTECN